MALNIDTVRKLVNVVIINLNEIILENEFHFKLVQPFLNRVDVEF